MMSNDEVMECFGFDDLFALKKWGERLQPDLIYKDTACLYTDGDSGIMLIQGWSEVFDTDGVQMRLIDCDWCDVEVDEMVLIMANLQRNSIRRQREWLEEE
jgi:hypothetical protein